MGKKDTLQSDKIRLPSRLAFQRLYKPKAFSADMEPRYEATFLVDPADKSGLEAIKTVLRTSADLSKQKWGKVPYQIKKLVSVFIPGQKPLDPKEKEDDIEVAFYDGDKKDYDGFAGMFVIPSHNKIRPALCDRKRKPVDAETDYQAPYSGCYVNGSIAIWIQDNEYGKRVNVNLRAVQFDHDGDPFGVQAVDAEDEFEALEDDENAAASFEDDVAF